MKTISVLLASAAFITTTSFAADLPACHRLMTEKECAAHLAQLTRLSPGKERNRYLNEYARTRKEREASCDSKRAMKEHVIVSWQRQALLAP